MRFVMNVVPSVRHTPPSIAGASLARATSGRAPARAGSHGAQTAGSEPATRALERSPSGAVMVDIFLPQEDRIEPIRDVPHRWPRMRVRAMSCGSRRIGRDTAAAGRKLVLPNSRRPPDIVAAARQVPGENA
jgi:DNA-binding NarL/FixJ family response regulator